MDGAVWMFRDANAKIVSNIALISKNKIGLKEQDKVRDGTFVGSRK